MSRKKGLIRDFLLTVALIVCWGLFACLSFAEERGALLRLPAEKSSAQLIPEVLLVPGGHSIGVLLRTEGVMVVGFSPVINEHNEPSFPAREAGIAIGDSIIEINGIKTASDDQVKKIIAGLKKENPEVEVKIKRNNKILNKVVSAQYCQESKSFRIGLFVRDNAGGVGTLTFYDPHSGRYGALGHLITDSETSRRLEISEGKILLASVEAVHKAKRGSPGEKVGAFIENSDLGSIEKNEECGIYGAAKKALVNPLYPQALAAASSAQIKPGAAQIITVVKGQELKAYDIVIEKVMTGRKDGKNMIIRISDKKLLEQTGGIIQGMSGSPIIQDGKIIGAVTHVFLNDPERGYGVFIEKMLYEAEIIHDVKALGLKAQGFYYSIMKEKLTSKTILMLEIAEDWGTKTNPRGKYIGISRIKWKVQAGNNSQLSNQ